MNIKCSAIRKPYGTGLEAKIERIFKSLLEDDTNMLVVRLDYTKLLKALVIAELLFAIAFNIFLLIMCTKTLAIISLKEPIEIRGIKIDRIEIFVDGDGRAYYQGIVVLNVELSNCELQWVAWLGWIFICFLELISISETTNLIERDFSIFLTIMKMLLVVLLGFILPLMALIRLPYRDFGITLEFSLMDQLTIPYTQLSAYGASIKISYGNLNFIKSCLTITLIAILAFSLTKFLIIISRRMQSGTR